MLMLPTTLIMFSALILIFTNQPLSLGLMVLLISLILAAMTSLLSSGWFAYMLFLVYVGGLLIMFSYVMALAPYKPFKSQPMLIFSVPLCIIFFGFMMPQLPEPQTTPLLPIFGLENFSLTASSLFSTYNMPLIISLAIILLLALVAVVKISFFQYGPLRPFHY